VVVGMIERSFTRRSRIGRMRGNTKSVYCRRFDTGWADHLSVLARHGSAS
jgi:hypothetical protein